MFNANNSITHLTGAFLLVCFISGCTTTGMTTGSSDGIGQQQQANAPTFRVTLNKHHVPLTPMVMETPDVVPIPTELKRFSRSAVLEFSQFWDVGVPCEVPGYKHLKRPMVSGPVSIYLTDQPPVRYDPLSVVIVTDPPYSFVYPVGTRLISYTAFYDREGNWLDYFPVTIQSHVVTDSYPVRGLPENAPKVTGIFSDANVQAFVRGL